MLIQNLFGISNITHNSTIPTDNIVGLANSVNKDTSNHKNSDKDISEVINSISEKSIYVKIETKLTK